MRVLVLSKQTVGNNQDGEADNEWKKANSMERNKNTLEFNTARDGPALTNFPPVLEAVMLKAPKERIKMFSTNRTTDASWSVTVQKLGGRDDLLSTMSLSSRKGWLINFGTLVVFMVERIMGEERARIKGGGKEADPRERSGSSTREPEKKEESTNRQPFLVRSWAPIRNGELTSLAG